MDKMKIIWSDFALENIEEIGLFLEKVSLQASQNVISAIFDRVDQLETFPNSGANEPKLKQSDLNYKFLVVYSYKIIYRIINENSVFITDVFPCKKDPVEIPFRTKETQQ